MKLRHDSLAPRRAEGKTNEAGLTSGMVGVAYISSRYKKPHRRPKLDLKALHAKYVGKTFGTLTVTDKPFWRERRDAAHIDYFFEARCSCGKLVNFRLYHVFREDGSPARHQVNMCRECYRFNALIKKRRTR
jgi:hypothetical protein